MVAARGSEGTIPEEHPFQEGSRAGEAPGTNFVGHGKFLLRFVAHHCGRMVLQVLPDPREVHGRLYAMLLEVSCRADATEYEELRGADGPRGHDDLPPVGQLSHDILPGLVAKGYST